MSARGVVRFGVFEVDLAARELRKRGVRVKLQEQPFRLLAALLERPGQVVTREEIQARLWPDDTFVDFDKSLNTAAQKVRQALGDSAETPRFVETIPRRGYRFVAPVEHSVPPGTVKPQAALWPRWIRVSGSLIGISVVIGAVLILGWDRQRVEPSTGLTGQPVLRQITFDTGLTTAPAVSPDGTLLAYASDRSGDGNLDIWVQKLPNGEPIRLTEHPAADTEPDFSPDSSTIVFASARDGGAILTVPALGGKITRIAGAGARPRFSPDGSTVLYFVGLYDASSLGQQTIEAVSLRGDESRRIAPGQAPVWSPDGESVISTAQSAGGDWILTTVESGESGPLGIADYLRSHGLSPSAYSGSWFRPDRFDQQTNAVVFTARLSDGLNIWRLSLDPQNWEPTNPPERLTFGVGDDTSPNLLPTGELIFARSTSNFDVWAVPIDADQGRVRGEAYRLTDDPRDELGPSASADGKRLTYGLRQGRQWSLWAKDLDNGRSWSFPIDDTSRVYPSITSSGTRLAYSIRPPGQSGTSTLFTAPFEGGPPTKVCSGCGDPRQWTLDESAIVTEGRGADGRGSANVNLVAVEEGTLQVIADSAVDEGKDLAVYDGSLSPDGKWVAFHQLTDSAARRIFVAPVPEGRTMTEPDWIPITDGSYLEGSAKWSPNGRLLYFISNRDGSHCIWAQRLDEISKEPLGEPFEVFAIHDARRRLLGRTSFRGVGLNVLADRLILSIDETTSNVWMSTYE